MAPVNDATAIGRKVDFLSGVNEQALRALFEAADSAAYPLGRTIVFRGEALNHLYLVETGAVVAKYKTPRGHMEIPLEEGSFFGELALCDDGTSQASVTTTRASTAVVAVAALAFKAFLDAQPEAKQEFLSKVAARRIALGAWSAGSPGINLN